MAGRAAVALRHSNFGQTSDVSDQHTFIYVDDSGDDCIGVSMTAVLIPAENWSTCLGYWTTKRADLETRHGLPRRFEIHSSAFLSAHPLKDQQRRHAWARLSCETRPPRRPRSSAGTGRIDDIKRRSACGPAATGPHDSGDTPQTMINAQGL